MSKNIVFVFGSNSTGFHGAGSAGFAFRGDSSNSWRQDAFFREAMRSPVGSPERIGKLAVFGVARGLQVGTEGMSYAIETIRRPGQRRSVSRREICKQLIQLWKFAEAHPEYLFKMTPVGAGYAGYSGAEMQEVVDWLLGKYGCPENIELASYQSFSASDT